MIPEATSPFMTRSISTGEAVPTTFENSSQIYHNGNSANGTAQFVSQWTGSRILDAAIINAPHPENRPEIISSMQDQRVLNFEENNREYTMGSNEAASQRIYAPSSSVSASVSTAPAVVVSSQTENFPQVRFIYDTERDLPTVANSLHETKIKKSRFKWSKPSPSSSVRNIGISKPVVVSNNTSAEPFARIKTIDLATAAHLERERREDAASRMRLIPKRPAPPPPSGTMEEGLRKSVSLKRKQTPSRRYQTAMEFPNNAASALSVNAADASTTSALLSPNTGTIRQRSPRNINGLVGREIVNASNSGLQRRPTIGLPSNPKSQRVLKTQNADPNQEVSINYTPDIDSDATAEKPETSYATGLKSSGSIIHRPRPYRRDTEKERALFPSGSHPLHRRSRSASPVAGSRKSIFDSHPGSPTQLPPMPAPPPRPADLAHILSSGNKSMTFHEKIQFLFPTPPASTLSNSRRSSVPSLPRLPSVYISETSPVQYSPDEEQSSRASRKSRIISFETEDIWASVARTTETGDRSSQYERSIKSSHTNNILAIDSNKVIPQSQSDHSSIDSRVHTLNGTTAQTRPVRRAIRPQEVDISAWSTSDDNRQSFFLDENQDLPGDKTPSPRVSSTWHRRIGDQLPTFSQRRKGSKSRKMASPTPLVLSWKGNGISVVVHSPAPSPVDTPGKAMKMLQAQLKHFEVPNHNVATTSSQPIHPSHTTVVDNHKDDHNSRSKLLEDLEEEMGLQENIWQKMQHVFDRDSNSVMLTPQPPTPTEDDLPQGSFLPPLKLQDGARNGKSLARTEASSSSVSSRSSSSSRAAGWRQRLTEAQFEYLDNASTLSRNGKLNFLLMGQSQIGSPTPPESIDSDTDIETGSESELEFSNVGGKSAIVSRAKSSMWQAQSVVPEPHVGGLWEPLVACRRTTLADAAAKDLRPMKRLGENKLSISSSELWSKPNLSSTSTFIGLWGSRKVRPKSIVIRRASQRPQRKSKRIGFLPDIGKGIFILKLSYSLIAKITVESPQPLPHKRDTLGIFQFPSGETSDSAVYHSAFSPTLQAISIVLNNIEQDTAEYPLSFFDDYDEQDDSDDFDSDDDFDESTLWEISSLLYSKDVSSMEDSPPLSAQRRNSFVAFEDGIQFEMTTREQSSMPDMAEVQGDIHSQPLQMAIQPLALSSKTNSKLWRGISKPEPKIQSIGLPQPDQMKWDLYISNCQSEPRSKYRASQALPVLTTSALWIKPSIEKKPQFFTRLWTPAHTLKNNTQDVTRGSSTSNYLLWMLQTQPLINETLVKAAPALWTPVTNPNSKITTGVSHLPAVREVKDIDISPSFSCAQVGKAQKHYVPLGKLTSSTLWTGHKDQDPEHHWISESSVRPQSPSIQSDSTSGGSTPTSDIISVKSSSTKASSIWSSLKSVQVSLTWNSKPQKDSAPLQPAEGKESSKSSASPPALSPQHARRESKVLAFRDLFELKSSQSEDTSARIQSRSNRSSVIDVDLKALDNKTLHLASSHALQPRQHVEASAQTWDESHIKNIVHGDKIDDLYDVTTRHPVFFTKDLSSSTIDMHPAAVGYVKKLNTKVELLWSNRSHIQTKKPRIEEPTERPRLWSQQAKLEDVENTVLMSKVQYSFQDLSREDRKRNGNSSFRQLQLQSINSTQLFQSCPIPRESSIHWLHSTSKSPENPSRSLTWELPSIVTTEEPECAGMWEPRTAASSSPPSLFSNPHIGPWIRKRRDSTSTKDITSSQLWRRSAEMPSKPKHWLVDRRASTVQFRY